MKSVALHNRLTKALLQGFLFLLFLFSGFSATAQQEIDEARQQEGRKIFRQKCSSCHKLEKPYIGPALGGVEERRENEWLKKWIRNNAALRASGDRQAIALYEEWNQSNMSAFPELTDEQIDNILYYTTVGELPDTTDPLKTGGQGPIEVKPTSPDWLIWLLAGAIVALFLVIAALLKNIAELKGAPKTPGLIGNTKELWEGIKKNTFLHVAGTIMLLFIAAYVGFGALFSVGVDQGYQPIQPIAFSHKIHAGENKIDCQYCHSSAKHSKHSGIPSVNVCMNCHKGIAEVSSKTVLPGYSTEQINAEIQKIYDAAGWDPEKLEYTGNEKPIKWIRIHNLPDFAYFNHSQHVTVGGLECQKCHGPVEEMHELYQYSPLTMGWCIDCHRETNVDLKGNGYYEKIHKELAEKYNVERVTAAQLGGLECGKCHY
jgi:mono/diheme cytochrome c family protein